jgi:hypothetical protein
LLEAVRRRVRLNLHRTAEFVVAIRFKIWSAIQSGLFRLTQISGEAAQPSWFQFASRPSRVTSAELDDRLASVDSSGHLGLDTEVATKPYLPGMHMVLIVDDCQPRTA